MTSKAYALQQKDNYDFVYFPYRHAFYTDKSIIVESYPLPRVHVWDQYFEGRLNKQSNTFRFARCDVEYAIDAVDDEVMLWVWDDDHFYLPRYVGVVE